MTSGVYERTKRHRDILSKVALRPETQQKKRLANLGNKNPMFGKKHSAETKQKISKKNFGRHNLIKNGIAKTNGYIKLFKPDHPFSNSQGYILQHRFIMERKIGRFLKPTEVVHHLDGNKSNNSPINLELIINQSEHKKLHPETQFSNTYRPSKTRGKDKKPRRRK